MFTAFSLLSGLTVSAGAQDQFNCDDFEFQEDAQAVFDQDRNDPNGLDGPIGPDNDTTGTPDLACERLPSRGDGGDDGTDDGATDDGATDDGGSDDGATDDGGSDGETSELPGTGTGPLVDAGVSTSALMFVTIAAFSAFAGIRIARRG